MSLRRIGGRWIRRRRRARPLHPRLLVVHLCDACLRSWGDQELRCSRGSGKSCTPIDGRKVAEKQDHSLCELRADFFLAIPRCWSRSPHAVWIPPKKYEVSSPPFAYHVWLSNIYAISKRVVPKVRSSDDRKLISFAGICLEDFGDSSSMSD